MRFLMVSHFFESHGGGIERVAGHLCRNLIRLSHECSWAASAADPAPSDGSILSLPLPSFDPIERFSGLPMPIPGPAGLGLLAKGVKSADCVIIHDSLYVTSILAMIAAKWYDKPVILIQHIAGIDFSSKIMRIIMALANNTVARRMLASADQVVFISETVRNVLARNRWKNPARLLFNGVDHDVFASQPGDRAQFGLPGQGRVACFVGRFVEKKGLAVIKALAKSRPDITFAMVGSGPIAPDSWKLSNVHLIGPLPPCDVAALFQSVDCLVLPSVGEGYPLVIQEAMATGLRVLCGAESAQADPEASEWINGVDVRLSDPEGTAYKFSQALDQIFSRDFDRKTMIAYARNRYSWQAMAREIGKIGSELSTR